jgi:excisionase family DNA binding protein
MIVMDGEEFLTAQEACALLGVKPATLYAYVSRGLLESYRQGIKRMRLYRRSQIDSLTRLHRPGAPGAAQSPDGSDEAARDDDSTAWTSYV